MHEPKALFLVRRLARTEHPLPFSVSDFAKISVASGGGPRQAGGRMIVEVSQFRLVAGADENAFLAAAERTQSEFLGQQHGFLGRDLLRADDGTWMDIVRFQDAESAEAAFVAFAGHPGVVAFESMLDPSSLRMTHWWAAKSW
jgi:hypothetical protein